MSDSPQRDDSVGCSWQGNWASAGTKNGVIIKEEEEEKKNSNYEGLQTKFSL